MKRRILATVTGTLLTITLILSMCLCFIDSPATAASTELAGYFQINYDPAVFSKTDILGSEAFNVTIHGNATCIKDLPITVKKGRVTGNITAVHSVNGTRVILQSTYTVDIGDDEHPFPSKQGQSVEMTVIAPLQFPAHGETGEYTLTAKTIKAEVYFLGGWSDATDMVPASETLGMVNYTAIPATPTPSPTPSPAGSPTPGPTFFKLTINLWNTNASEWRMDGLGYLLEDAAINSSDGSIGINAPANTRVLDADAEPLSAIIIAPTNTALTPVKGYRVVSAYDCKPDGASFIPGIEITLAYNPGNLPAGADETNLKVAYFDKAHPDGEFVSGSVTIDKNKHTVTFSTNHFSDFAILAPVEDTDDSGFTLPQIITVCIVILAIVLISAALIMHRRASR